MPTSRRLKPSPDDHCARQRFEPAGWPLLPHLSEARQGECGKCHDDVSHSDVVEAGQHEVRGDPSSHALATYPPARVQPVRIATPTANSTTPTMPMNVAVDTGRNPAATGLTYEAQSASRLKNLSMPASVAVRPMPNRSAIHGVSSRLSIEVAFCSLEARSAQT